MESLIINPEYRELLIAQGLTTLRQFMDRETVIVSGHPTRHVGELTIGECLRAFIKKQHVVSRKERLVNCLTGHGFVSNCRREAMTLSAAAKAGIGCPDWIAAG